MSIRTTSEKFKQLVDAIIQELENKPGSMAFASFVNGNGGDRHQYVRALLRAGIVTRVMLPNSQYEYSISASGLKLKGLPADKNLKSVKDVDETWVEEMITRGYSTPKDVVNDAVLEVTEDVTTPAVTKRDSHRPHISLLNTKLLAEIGCRYEVKTKHGESLKDLFKRHQVNHNATGLLLKHNILEKFGISTYEVTGYGRQLLAVVGKLSKVINRLTNDNVDQVRAEVLALVKIEQSSKQAPIEPAVVENTAFNKLLDEDVNALDALSKQSIPGKNRSAVKLLVLLATAKINMTVKELDFAAVLLTQLVQNGFDPHTLLGVADLLRHADMETTLG